MQPFFLEVGQEVSFAKTVSESDVYLFAGITGDFNSNHVNQEVMSKSKYGERIAHGALMVGFMSTTSTMMIDTYGRPPGSTATAVSLGYDRVRFLAGVRIGDTITVRYRVTHIEPERDRSRATVTVTNQDGVEVAVAEHILKWVYPDA
ncbi:MAG: MaoC/PaaZ C-terminal domain-containing protein [Parvibaculaceae bacterium]